MKKNILYFIITTVFVISSLFSIGQPPFNPPNPYQNCNGTGIYGGGLHNTSAPVDGGLGILLTQVSHKKIDR